MPRVPSYGNQWNILPPSSASADELRACVYYEYARESESLIRAVANHRLTPNSTDHYAAQGIIGLTYLDEIELISVPVANMVRAMGAQASLTKPWSKLSAKLRARMAAACAASVRLATPDEIEASYCWPCHDEMPPAGTIFHIGPESDDAAGGDPRRLLCLVLDTRATAAQISDDIVRVFHKHFARHIGGSTGRAASGKDPLRAALRALAVLRLLSTRDLSIAQTIAQRAGQRDLLPEKKKDSTRYQRVRAAQRTFRDLFPGFFRGEEFADPPQMISEAAYSAHRSRSAGRKRRR